MKQAHITTVSKPIERMIPHPKNPNTHDDRQIKKLRHLIKTHGYSKGSVVYQLSTGYILAGHGIVEALKAEKYTHVDAVELDIDDIKAEAFMIADNKIAMDSIIDDTALQQLITNLSEQNVPSLDFGFDSADLEELASRILADSGGYTATPQDDEIPDEVKPITKTGDLWTLGKHRVLCGDSTKAEDVARLMGGEKADTIFSDPPYNVGRDYGDDTNDNQTPEQYKQWQLSWMKILPIGKDGDIFCTPGLRYCILTANCLSEIYHYVWIIAWEKLNSMMRSATGFNTWEPILWFKNGVAKGYGNHRYDIINCPTVVSKGIDHPTPKNVNLIVDLFAIKGDKLKSAYDPFLGSGTTLIACEKLNRVCYGMEISPAYCDVIVNRYIDFVGSSEQVFCERDDVKIGYADLNR